MYQELRKQAEKKVEAKVSFFTTAIVFSFTTVVLIMLSFYLPGASFWLRLPIPIFIMVLAVQYLAAFGLPTTGELSENWREDEVEKELIRLYRKKKVELAQREELTDTEVLELKELERLQAKWNRGEDYL